MHWTRSEDVEGMGLVSLSRSLEVDTSDSSSSLATGDTRGDTCSGTGGGGWGGAATGAAGGWVVLVTSATEPLSPGTVGSSRPLLSSASSRFLVLRTWARGGPGGSSMTVTTLVLSARSLLPVHRSMAQSTSCLLGLIQLVAPGPSTLDSMCCSFAWKNI